MKKIIVQLFILCAMLTSCNSSQSTTGNTSQSATKKTTTLQGTWELYYITGPRIAFAGLYPDKKPTITFHLGDNHFYGNNSCNSYSGALKIDENRIDFKDTKMAMTMMACAGEGQDLYMTTLETVDSYSFSPDGKFLIFMAGDVEVMRFEKKPEL